MRIAVMLTLDVDPEAWTATYGVEGAAAIREDVKAYAANQVTDSAAGSECSLVVLAYR